MFKYPTERADTVTTPNYPAYSDGTSGAGAPSGYNSGASGAQGWAVDAAASNKVAPWALGLAILAFLVGFIPIIGLPVGLIALIVAIIAVVKGRKLPDSGRRLGMSISALVLSIIGLALSAVWVAAVVFFITDSEIQQCFELTDETAISQCFTDRFSK